MVSNIVTITHNTLTSLMSNLSHRSKDKQDEEVIVIHDIFTVYYSAGSLDLGYAPYLYWGWVVSIGGPVVYLLAVVHAVMWTRISSILGSVVSKSGYVRMCCHCKQAT